ncbi:MAG TPA: TonB family protein [Candidatus Sulfotelmatobacter sp.]|nr:TonB family protein [Candidatus Sulfotelmatobacter sp.]
MTQPFRLPDLPNEEPSREEHPSGEAGFRFAGDDNDEISQVARTLAEHGGGAVAFDLALDLVLNEIVEQARSATGATGAAIALTREGEMVCRATTGTNAPDLGVRVETDSGLSGECLKSGEIQHCSDTESDPRVNAEACRQLGVRSMLIAPIRDSKECVGILEVLSTAPHAFGEKDFFTLRGLARRVLQDKHEAEEGVLNPPELHETAGTKIRNEQAEQAAAFERPPDSVLGTTDPTSAKTGSPAQPAAVKRTDALSSVLVVLLISVAVLLGVMIGWRRAVLRRDAISAPAASSDAATMNPPPGANVPAGPTSNGAGAAETAALEKPKTAHAENSVPTGGLLVTQNGKVIYRVEPVNSLRGGATRTPQQSSANRIIHQVAPEYPPKAKAQGIQGPVVLDVQVGGDGRVSGVQVISGDPVLADAAVSAVKQWIYTPFSVDGKPVERQSRITLRFTLPRS